MQPIAVPPGLEHQARAMRIQIFVLELVTAGEYRLLPTEPGAAVPALDGGFTYVILPDAPTTIYVGLIYDQPPFLRVTGHAGLSAGQPVLYAGELLFCKGVLRYWSNDSGHYRPPKKMQLVNILPPVRALLPITSFVDWYE